jgi:Flp pilus assembly protein TadD
MKKVFTGALAVMMVLSLVACAGTKGDPKIRVKCPACGYEFDAPTE